MLVWVDVETTGLDAERDLLLELAIVVTDDKLKELTSQSWVTDQAQLRELSMLHPVVQEMHTRNGLWVASREQGMSLRRLETTALDFLRDAGVQRGEAQLAGSTISFDRSFLRRHLPMVESHLHYRNLDVTTLNEIARRFWPMVHEGRPSAGKEATHRAGDDIQQSIETLKYYLKVIDDWRSGILF